MPSLTIDAMHCQNCVRHVQKVFTKSGLNAPTIDLEARTVTTDAAPDALPALLQALATAGYPVTKTE
jgi:copper chaperone CopZ